MVKKEIYHAKLRHMPSTPMTQEEMLRQCEIVSEAAKCDPGEEEEEWRPWEK